jgi:pyruvate-ferredoxin/flavodoxin oxidoreductase
MPSLSNSTLRLLRRVLGAPRRGPGAHAGIATVLDGNTAIAHTEAGICDAAGIGGSFPADSAGLAWRLEQRRLRVNAFGAPLATRAAESGRGALAAAIGLTLAGARATCFLSGADLTRCRDLLDSARAQRLPLVLHLAGRDEGGPGASLGNAHEAFHLGAAADCLVLVAANVQEAIDFTLLARRICEQALLPAVIAMDGSQTALAIQDARPASTRLIRDLLGDPNDLVRCAEPSWQADSAATAYTSLQQSEESGPGTESNDAQQFLFGEERRRLPRWHDPDHPVMIGALQPAAAAGPGRAAVRAYLDRPLQGIVDAAFTRFAEVTGRSYQSISDYCIDDANLILLAMGSAIETAEAVADRLRARYRIKAGVIGLRRLHPFPGPELVRLLGRNCRICVLECADVPLSEDPPLLGKLRSALDHAAENHIRGFSIHADYPALPNKDRPRLLSVIYGLGGLPLRAADLLLLCRNAGKLLRPRVYLGIDFLPATSHYPKRQVLLDRLRRAYPGAASLGLAEGGKTAAKFDDLRPAGAITLAIQRRDGSAGSGLAAEAAALLHRVDGGGLRGRPDLFVQPWGNGCIDRVTSASQPLREPGDDCPVDLCLRLTDRGWSSADGTAALTANGLLMVQTALPEERCWAWLSEAERVDFKAHAGRLYLLPPPASGSSLPGALPDAASNVFPDTVPDTLNLPDSPVPDPVSGDDGLDDYRLGAICGLLLQQGLMDLPRRRLLGLRAEMLRHTVADVDARLQLFETGLDAPRRIDTARLPRRIARGGEQNISEQIEEATALVRSIGGGPDSYDSLPNFWDRFGVLYRNGDMSELSPDPLLAIGTIPALSAGFRDLSTLRDRLPLFDPDQCTGCGACWTACPESAIAAVAVTPKQIIDTGLNAGGADALRPLASKLVGTLVQLCQQAEFAPGTAAEMIDSAYAQLAAKMRFPEERKQAMTKALNRMLSAVGTLPLVATDGLFREAESEHPGRGALLALSLNPDTCKACGLCVAVCAPNALRIERQSTRALSDVRRIRAAWDLLPNTETAVIERANGLFEPGALAATLLNRDAARAMIGGDGNEPGSGARLALRLTLAALQARQSTMAKELGREIDDLRECIAALVRDTLADALPASDLDALAERLRRVASRQAELGDLLGQVGEAVDASVDAARLRRLVNLARDLGDWAWRLRQGSHGLGRAACGIVLSPGAAVGWAGAFPDNPFAEPVVLDWTRDGAQLAAGLLQGQLSQATRDLVLLRRARLELERPADAARLWADLDALSWRDLNDQELARCPSLLLVGDSTSLAGAGLAQLYQLLGTDLPLRVLLLADLDLGLGPHAGLGLPAAAIEDAAIDIGLLALSKRDCYLAQSSIAMPEHLAMSLNGAFVHRGPALLHIHAPSPGRHGFASERTLERAQAGIAARVFPLMRYDPGADGVFGSRIDLSGNPDPVEPWAYMPDGQPMTPAHWALGEGRFAELFRPLPENAPEATALVDYLQLPPEQRDRRTPTIERAANGAERQLLQVDDALVRVCRERSAGWQALQELAGLVTPFTARVEQQAEERVAARHHSEITNLMAEHQDQIQRLRADYEQQLRRDIKDRLMALAGYEVQPPTPPHQSSPATAAQRSENSE